MKGTFAILTFLTLVTTSPQILAQSALEPDWLIHKAGTVPNAIGEAWGVDVDHDGRVYWGVSETRPGIFEGLDGVTYQLDADGNVLWESPAYGGPFSQQIYATSVSGDTVYSCGRTCSNASVNLETCEMMIIAMNAKSGDTLWTTTWGRGHGYEEADWVAVKDDGLYVGGWSDGGTSDWDAGLLHLGFDGHLIWSNAWGTDNIDHQDGHIAVDDSMIYGGGLYSGGRSAVIILKGFDGHAMLAKWRRSDGGHVAHVTFGRDDPWTNLENSLGLGTDGTYLYVVGNTTIGPQDNQMFIRKYDKNLNLQWERLWGGSNTETSRSVVVGDDGIVYVAASTKTYGAGDFDAAIVRYSKDGGFLGYRTWGGTGDDQAYDIAAHGRRLYVTGRTTSLAAGGTAEGFIIAVTTDSLADATSPDDAARDAAALRLEGNRPDPFHSSTTITFSLPHTADARLVVYDMLGREVATLASGHLEAGWHTVEWNAGGLPAGRYLCRLTAGGSVATDAMILER
jgi:hypothetical protein